MRNGNGTYHRNTHASAGDGAAETGRATAAQPGLAGLALQFDPAILAPLIRQVVEATVARLEEDRAKLDGRLAYSEAEAAALLGLEPHQLRDERRRGRIGASSIVGRRVRYTREDLVRYLAERRVDGINEG